jgi:hypothetical protein
VKYLPHYLPLVSLVFSYLCMLFVWLSLRKVNRIQAEIADFEAAASSAASNTVILGESLNVRFQEFFEATKVGFERFLRVSEQFSLEQMTDLEIQLVEEKVRSALLKSSVLPGDDPPGPTGRTTRGGSGG